MKYCCKNLDDFERFGNVDVDKNTIKASDHYHNSIHCEWFINYCPFCGTKLEKDK